MWYYSYYFAFLYVSYIVNDDFISLVRWQIMCGVWCSPRPGIYRKGLGLREREREMRLCHSPTNELPSTRFCVIMPTYRLICSSGGPLVFTHTVMLIVHNNLPSRPCSWLYVNAN